MKKIAIVNRLAAQIRKMDSSFTRSTSMKTAWATVKSTPEIEVITFMKVDGKTETTRVISRQWSKYQTPKESGRQLKEGQIVVADIAKFLCSNSNCVISLYTQNIK